MALLPVTLEHPSEKLTPQNAGPLVVGAASRPDRVGNHARVSLLVHRADAIAAIEAGKIQLSYGYRTKVEPKSGVWTDENGQQTRYDAVQTQIQGNHLAIVDRARGGPTLAMRLDGLGMEVDADDRIDGLWTTAYVNALPDAAFAAIEPGGQLDDEGKTVPRSLRHLPHHTAAVHSGTENSSVDVPHLRDALSRAPQTMISPELRSHAEMHLRAHAKVLLATPEEMARKDATGNKEGEKMVKRKIGDVEVEIPDGAAAHFDSLSAQLERTAGELAAFKAKGSEAEAQARRDSEAEAIAARIELVTKASAILGKTTAELLRMDAVDVMREVIAHELPSVKTDGKSAEYVRAVFDTVAAGASRVDTTDEMRRMADDAKRAEAKRRADGQIDPADKARNEMIQRDRDAWRTKPAQA
jgi:hypothetical protein